jgi:osmotically inducible lipoprotein OsmB
MEATMRLNKLLMGGVLASAIALAGCGTDPGDRALSGGMIGAGAGAIIGAATGTPATGAAIGAATGALIGAATDPCTLNLGDPFWRDHGGRAGYERRCGHPPPR